jgi:hypothetical protein
LGNLKKPLDNILIGKETTGENQDSSLGNNLKLSTNSPGNIFVQFRQELAQVGLKSASIEKSMELQHMENMEKKGVYSLQGKLYLK